MKNYNDEYYIVFERFDEHTLYLEAQQKSADRDPGHVKLSISQGPLFFENSYKEEDVKSGLSKPLLKAHMNLSSVVFVDSIREKIKDFDIFGVQVFPSVIVDDFDKIHDGYWYINVFDSLDCLDLPKCFIEDFDPSEEDHYVEKYHLSSHVLDSIVEEHRLIIRPDKISHGYLFSIRK